MVIHFWEGHSIIFDIEDVGMLKLNQVAFLFKYYSIKLFKKVFFCDF